MTPRDPDHRRRVDALFDEALDLPPEAREALLAARAEDEPDTVAEVRSLLAAADREGILDADPAPALERGVAELLPGAAAGEDLRERLQSALDRYRIIRELGRGGMAVVYLAWEKKHDRQVVLKVLRPEVAALYGADRFLQEVRLAGRLSHPHILGLIDSGAVDGLLYYVMPWVEGESLRDRMEREGPLPLATVLRYLRDVAAALGHAHAHGVIHRDLKPDNVLCAGRHAYLMDFGVAKSLRPDGGSGAEGEGRPETRVGVAVGTPRYMAPEQSGTGPGEGVDGRTDLFAWGQMARELLTSEPPPDATVEETVERRVTAIRRARPETPRALARIVARCSESDPDRRPADAGEVLRVVEPLLAPGEGEPAPPPLRGLRWAVAVAAVVAILLAIQLVDRQLGDPPLPEGRMAPAGAGRGAGGPGAAGTGASGVAEAGVPGPVAVAEFRNETGDSAMAFLGRLAGDWVTQGLQESGVQAVVPWSTALAASRRAEALGATGGAGSMAGEASDVVEVVRNETGAGTVITGSFYRVGSEIRFQALVTDAVRGRVLSAPEPAAAPLDSAQNALAELRSRVMASLAVASDERAGGVPGLTRHPPTFEAYRAFDRGLDHYLAQEYGDATEAFLQAWDADTTFLVALVYGATTAYNRGDLEAVDTILARLEVRRDRLTRYDDHRLDFLSALADGDGTSALRAIRAAAELAPGSRSVYNRALVALSVNRPAEALAALESLDPDRGEIRGWAQYWTQLTHALHLLGRHGEEAEAAAEMRRRHPERRVAGVLEVRARAAAGDTAGVDAVLASLAGLPPRSYWSQGAARVVAGEELLAHGRPAAGEAYLEEGLAWLRTQVEQTPDYSGHRYWLATALYDLGRWEEALEACREAIGMRPGDTSLRATAAAAEARAGRRAEALAWLEEGFERAPGTRAAAEARVEAVLGERERAFLLLSTALGQGIDAFPWYHAAAHRDLSPLADDPRYAALVEAGAP